MANYKNGCPYYLAWIRKEETFEEEWIQFADSA